MLKDKLTKLKANDGFTIIEVIIVLVIAAVIMLMVFLIVPQLQRTQRNSARQNYARQVLSAATQFYANGGTNLSGTDITTITGTQNDPSSQAAYSFTVTGASNTVAPAQGGIFVATRSAKCSSNNFAPGTGYAVVIAIEPFATPQTNFYCVADN